MRALHQVSAYAAEYGLTLGQRTCDEKSCLGSVKVGLNAPGHCRRQVSLHETQNKGHVRIETCRCLAVGELDWLELLGLKARRSKPASAACIDSTREIAGRVETDKRYVISSLPADSRRLLHAVRTHWGIENGPQWCLDVTFGEDASLICLRNAAQNFSFLHRLALNHFRSNQSRSISLPRKLKIMI